MLEEFSERAMEFVRLAERTQSTDDRSLFMEIARAWYGISEHDSDIARFDVAL
jgi:hypothetical protein